jgi:outer membrane receptor protein involved in Fe transport
MPGDLVDDEVYDAHTVVNTSFVYTTGGGNLDITLWARNLLDEEYENSRRYVSGIVYTQNRYALPRTYGVKAEYRF